MSVSCANLKGDTSLQALVTVFYHGSNTVQDVYVYDHITDAQPVQLFKLQGLTSGDAGISDYSTVMTAEVDQNSSLNKGKSSDQWQQDLFREFAWNNGQKAFAQVAFPGIFPDLTRWQAEADQRDVSTGSILEK